MRRGWRRSAMASPRSVGASTSTHEVSSILMTTDAARLAGVPVCKPIPYLDSVFHDTVGTKAIAGWQHAIANNNS